jgi:Ca-activated chloride channel homolog
MNGWDFAAPWVLVFLPLPLLVMRVLPQSRQLDGALRVPPSLAAQADRGEAWLASPLARSALAWLLWTALLVAMAGPRMVVDAGRTAASGRQIVLALDLSGSMERRDFEIDGQPASRLEALKKVGAEFVRRRAGDWIGLVVFAEEAYSAAPLSFDKAAVSRLIETMTIGLVGRSTAIGDGLGLALKRLANSDAPSRIVILLSDGSNNTGTADPVQVARLGKELGVRIFTIALGLNDTVTGGDDPDAVDTETLQKVADIGGGEMFRVRTTGDLEAASREIEKLVAGSAIAPPRVVYSQFWIYPAIVALCFAFLLMFGRGRQ